MNKSLTYLIAAICLCACSFEGGQQGALTSSTGTKTTGKTTGKTAIKPAASAAGEKNARAFPMISVPAVYGNDTAEARNYVLGHYWDAFINGDGVTDAEMILGVKDKEVEQGLANYILLLSTLKQKATPDEPGPLHEAQKSILHFFKQIEARQLADTTSLLYVKMSEMVSHYLYDPISPVRDEDLYLPFVKALADSPCTGEDMRTAYRYEAKMCATNTFGSKAPDFRFSDIKGRKGSLYEVKAEYTMLFFSNPGCESCKAIVREIRSHGRIDSLIAEGRLAVVNIYIDEAVQEWREYHRNYPDTWINGYDYTFSLRESGKYDIRAIPSLYLLDSSKRVLMKDAVTENVLSFLDTI